MAGKARKSTHSKKASSKVLASRSKSKPAAPKKHVEINETKHYDVAEIGPVYLVWGKRVRVTKRGSLNSRRQVAKEYYLKKDSKHRIWVKWIDPFQDVLEDDNDGAECKWSAEPQSIFEGHMKKMVKEALEKKVVWPWIDRGDEDADKRKSVLKSCGYTEWKNPENGEWKLRYALPQADTSGQSDSDSDDTSSTTDKEGEDED